MKKREGILIPDMQSGRADIRFNSDDCYGGLHWWLGQFFSAYLFSIDASPTR